MKKYRRIEVTAFRRRVVISSHGPVDATGDDNASVADTESSGVINTHCDAGQAIVTVVRILEENADDLESPTERS